MKRNLRQNRSDRKRILLIRPEQNERSMLGLPLGLLYIAAVLRQNDFDVKIIDCLLKKHNIRSIVKKERPAIVGITNLYSPFKEKAIGVCRIVKDVDKDIITVVGGNHASVAPEDFLNNGFDIAVIGEGEYTMLDIARGKRLEDIKGIAYKRGGKIITKPPRWSFNLDALPLPAYDLIDMEEYFNKNSRTNFFGDASRRSITMITSRGCPNNCCFCSIRLGFGQFWRAHSAENVLNHLELVTKKYGVENIDFEDDNLTFDPVRFEAILDGMKERGINITWKTPNGVRVDTLNRRLLRKMKEQGLLKLVIGVESGSQKVIDNIIDKKIRLEYVVKIARICKEEKIQLGAFFIIGLPGETKKDIEQTLDFAYSLLKNYGVVPQLSKADAKVGTRMTSICMKNNWLKDGRISTDEFTPEDIDRYYRDFYRRISIPLLFKMNYKTIIKNRGEMLNYLKSRLFLTTRTPGL